jgi:hypothetical protein
MSGRRPRAGELNWNAILVRAAEIVKSYNTGVTLRQLYYRLVSEGLIPNRVQSYKTLSAKSAAARREGWFPNLIDRTRAIEQYRFFESPQSSLEWLADIYRRDRTEGQEWSVYIGVEKHGLTVQLQSWFGDDRGIPVLALGGYSSQTFVDVVASDVHKQGRPSVLLYAGDFDPSGMDIDRDFIARTEIFDETVRVALTAQIVQDYNLPPMPGKAEDSRSTRFIMEHGELVQVELDALPPQDLRDLYEKALEPFWDADAYAATMEQEEGEVTRLSGFVEEAPKEDWQRAANIIDTIEDGELLEIVRDAAQARLDELEAEE